MLEPWSSFDCVVVDPSLAAASPVSTVVVASAEAPAASDSADVVVASSASATVEVSVVDASVLKRLRHRRRSPPAKSDR